MNDALIHLRVPAATKARWVRESRAAGMRLTDWICQHLSAGGERDAVADDLIAEVRAEDAAGQQYSHAPGRA